MEGVTKAEVSLNKAMATIHLKPENNVSVEQLRKVVRKSGFTPKEATVIIDGDLETKKGDWFVVAGQQARYRLVPYPKDKDPKEKEKENKWAALQQYPKDQRIRVTGVIPTTTKKRQKKEAPLKLELLDFKKAPPKQEG